ncbi:Ribosomal protein L34 [Cynara cardunculus var. scolymus]|uniref:Ribosomal protein L34 n=1 Tax=Cynara cardunculus var. scolymus TaxID=59895 RepID=A0A103XW27_CYNCS|nr:Ribosomal protein L34 [Cynara cardunculus var. scolymus]
MDTETMAGVSLEAFLYPCGVPSLRLFLPDGEDSSSSKPLCIKRTYQPSTLRRKRVHGYLARYISFQFTCFCTCIYVCTCIPDSA